MKLEEYLIALEKCPDEKVEPTPELRVSYPLWRLTTELGVYDNWPIFLKTDFERTANDLLGMDFTAVGRKADGDLTRCVFHYNPGTVELILTDYSAEKNQKNSRGFPDVVRAERCQKRKRTIYNVGIMLHPYLDREIEGLPEIKGLPHNHPRALALIIGKIGEYAINREIPLCFPDSKGWAHTEDYSRIVFFP